MLVELTIEEGVRLKVIYGSNRGFHAIDLDTASVSDIYIPAQVVINCNIFVFEPGHIQAYVPLGWYTGASRDLQ